MEEGYQERLKEMEAEKQYISTDSATPTPCLIPEAWPSESEAEPDLETEISTIPPLMYLSEEHRKELISSSELKTMKKGKWIVEVNGIKNRYSCFLITEGEAHVFDYKKNFLELIKKGTFFGVDGPLFGKRFYSIMAATNMTLLQIPLTTFEKLLTKDSVFTLSIARNLAVKHNILETLNSFKTFVRQCRVAHEVDKEELINRYKRIESCLHPLCNSTEIDVDGWLYAIRRLPSNVTSTFIFHISTKTPDMLSHPDISLPIHTSARPRTILRIVEGKCVVILRDLETDLFDFISNLCIHVVEAGKIILRLNSPIILKDLIDNSQDQGNVASLLSSAGLTIEEVVGLEKIWPNGLGEHLANILLHYNDFYIKITEPLSHLKQDPIEKWITNLWVTVKQLLNLSPKVSPNSIPDNDMVVDLIQVMLNSYLYFLLLYLLNQIQSFSFTS